MNLNKRIEALSQLGSRITNFTQEERQMLYTRAGNQNNWFTPENIDLALKGAQTYLNKENLRKWTAAYEMKEPQNPKVVGIVMAGNIPLVGLHDLIAVLISGHKAKIKLSSQDQALPQYLIDRLLEIEPEFGKYIEIADQLKNIEAVIATGSDNTARYFNYYFSKYPHVIRKNRSSCAVLKGDESEEDFLALGQDIFQYYGLGCRNISKVYVPAGYDFQKILDSLAPFQKVMNHHKYVNNYDYNKSIYLVNRVPHLDTGFLLVTPNEGLVSPISVIFYEEYTDQEVLKQKLEEQADKLQCMVSKDGSYPGSLAFGEAQQPELWDYADRVDTLEFLLSL
jgi:hypothetical protein